MSTQNLPSSPASNALNKLFSALCHGLDLKSSVEQGGMGSTISYEATLPKFVHGPLGWQLAYLMKIELHDEEEDGRATSDWYNEWQVENNHPAGIEITYRSSSDKDEYWWPNATAALERSYGHFTDMTNSLPEAQQG